MRRFGGEEGGVGRGAFARVVGARFSNEETRFLPFGGGGERPKKGAFPKKSNCYLGYH